MIYYNLRYSTAEKIYVQLNNCDELISKYCEKKDNVSCQYVSLTRYTYILVTIFTVAVRTICTCHGK